MAREAAKSEGIPNVPVAVYPGAIDTHSKSEMEGNLKNFVIDQIVHGLTQAQAGATRIQKLLRSNKGTRGNCVQRHL